MDSSSLLHSVLHLFFNPCIPAFYSHSICVLLFPFLLLFFTNYVYACGSNYFWDRVLCNPIWPCTNHPTSTSQYGVCTPVLGFACLFIVSCYIALAGLELGAVLLLLPPECWDYRHVLPYWPKEDFLILGSMYVGEKESGGINSQLCALVK